MITTIKSSRDALIVVSFEHSQVWLFNLNPTTRRSPNVIHSRAYILFALILFCQLSQLLLVRSRCKICMRLYFMFNMMRKPNEIHTHTPKLILVIQYAARWTLSCENQKAIKISVRARKKCGAVKMFRCNSFACAYPSLFTILFAIDVDGYQMFSMPYLLWGRPAFIPSEDLTIHLALVF